MQARFELPALARKITSIVVPSEAEGRAGTAPGGWQTAGRKRHRSRHRVAPLHSMFIWANLSLNLGGLCFNCLSDKHVAGMCHNETVFLHCRQPGHITRESRALHSRSPPQTAAAPPPAGRAPARDCLWPRVTPPPPLSHVSSSSY
ncbi:hypothetical protein D1007_40143 [Hordeum vulgare]|nr:hypothetical protein D1007_40143 [Hordeum vulgare]